MNRKNCDTCGNFDLPICNACTRKYDEPPTKWVPNEQYTPKTNADRIRAMSDEELAAIIHAVSLGWKGETKWCDFHCENPGEDGCDKCILNWLQQPCGGADHE